MTPDDPSRGGSPSGDGPRGPRGPRGQGGERPRGPRGGGPFGLGGPGGFPGFPGGPGGFRGGPHHGGPGGWGGPRRGGRARRGDVRAAVLALLAEEPRNGYQLITEIEQRSGGAWKPSPGSVYPVLQQLEDEDLVTPSTEGGRKAFVLTETGRTAAAARSGSAPWDEARDDLGESRVELMDGLRQVGGALWQVASAGTPAQQREAAAVLADTRSRLYRLLADGADADRAASTGGESDQTDRDHQADQDHQAGQDRHAGPSDEAGPATGA